MTIEKTFAFVLQRRPWKDRHQIVWLLTESHGFLPTITYGIGNFGSRRSGHLDVANFCEIELEKRKEIWSIRHAHALNVYSHIKKNFLTATSVLAIFKLLLKILPTEMPQPALLDFMKKTLHALDQKPFTTQEEVKNFYHLFERKTLELLGFNSARTHVRPEHIRDHLERSEEALELFV